MRILSVFGTRPEAIKMAPIIRRLAVTPGTTLAGVRNGATFRQMLDQVLSLFSITPDKDLDVMFMGEKTVGLPGSPPPCWNGMADVYADLRAGASVLVRRAILTTTFAASLVQPSMRRFPLPACRGWAADRQCSFPLAREGDEPAAYHTYCGIAFSADRAERARICCGR